MRIAVVWLNEVRCVVGKVTLYEKNGWTLSHWKGVVFTSSIIFV